MSKYNIAARHFAGLEENALTPETVAGFWRLFVAICRQWDNVADPSTMQTRFRGFLGNRVERNPSYVMEYRNAVAVIAELTQERGEQEAYNFLLTNAEAAHSPPETPLQRARQRVANEFINLQLSLGGFRAFTGARNYPGYIAGVNGSGPAPYRTA
jgi:hypothetical protein